MQAITDVVGIDGDKYVRPIYAGNALCTVSSSDAIKLFTIRSTNFEKVKPADDNGTTVEALEGFDVD